MARERVAQAGLDGRVTVLLEDYRDLRGRYDKLVSVEMLEAVGAERYREFFGRCSALLEPDGLAAIQVIVYAGAVVVLFIFVIMLINVPESRLPVERATGMRLLGVVAAGLFILESAVLAGRYAMPPGHGNDSGSVAAVGRALFTDYLLAFEITSVLLLAAVVGAIVLAKKKI